MITRPVSRDGHAPIVRRKLYQDVMDRLLDLIEQRRLRPGDTLPSERELMDLYGVGRPAIREAIQNLSRVGILTVTHGGRTRLAEPSVSQAVDQMSLIARHVLTNSPASLDHLKQARLVYEMEMARQAAVRQSAAAVAELRARIAAQAAALDNSEAFMRSICHTGAAAAAADADFGRRLPTSVLSPGCYVPGEMSVWGSVTGAWGDLDGDAEARGYTVERRGVYFGADYALTERIAFGLAGGWVENDLEFDQDVDSDGFQIGAYGAYDTGSFYSHAKLSYGRYDADARRRFRIDAKNRLDIDRCGPECELADNSTPFSDLVKGSFDTDVWSAKGEVGYRVPVAAANVTPFAALEYARAEIDGFREAGGVTALTIGESDHEYLGGRIGLRLNTEIQTEAAIIVPEVGAAFEHDFKGGGRPEVGAAFTAAPGSDFIIVGSRGPKNFALVDAGVSVFSAAGWGGRISYDGRFGDGYDEHRVSGRLTYHFMTR